MRIDTSVLSRCFWVVDSFCVVALSTFDFGFVVREECPVDVSATAVGTVGHVWWYVVATSMVGGDLNEKLTRSVLEKQCGVSR